MFTLTTLSSPDRSSAIFSSTGATAWHGPHHSAQKSTITGCSLCKTSWSKVCVVTESNAFLSRLPYPDSNDSGGRLVPVPEGSVTPAYNRPMPPFQPLPQAPDNNALELEILDWWEREGIF